MNPLSLAFIALQFLGCIVLWVLILATLRENKIKPPISVQLSLVLSIIFLSIIIRLSFTHLMFYGIFGLFYMLYILVSAKLNGVQLKLPVDMIVSFLYWPQVISYSMFLQSISDQEVNEDQ